MRIIVFISKETAEIQAQCLTLLTKHLPNEKIVFPEQIDESQNENVDIAIVANPDPNIIKKYPNLIWIQSLWAGVERLVNEISLEKVKLVRLIDPNLANKMAEAVLAWTLYLHRNMPEYAQQQSQRKWKQLSSIEAKSLRVSILGIGALGIASANLLKNMNYQVNGWSRTLKNIEGITTFSGTDGLHSMIKATDILISLLPLTPQTHHLLNNSLLSKLPKGAKLINFSRGAIIEIPALLSLLEEKHISHAVLDVFDEEPLPQSSELWSNSNITILPHISAPTNIDSAVEIITENINNYRANDKIPMSVNLKQGY